MTASLEETLRALERAWREGGNLDALRMAVDFCRMATRPLPAWASEAVCSLLGELYMKRRSGRPGGAAFLRKNLKHVSRWYLVNVQRDKPKDKFQKDAKREKTWLAIYEYVAERESIESGGKPITPDAVKKSYMLIEKAVRDGKGAVYGLNYPELG
jgi:hypothetical protein